MRIAICALKKKIQDAKTANQKESHVMWSVKGFMLAPGRCAGASQA